MGLSFTLNDREKAFLAHCARCAIESGLAGRERPIPQPDAYDGPAVPEADGPASGPVSVHSESTATQELTVSRSGQGEANVAARFGAEPAAVQTGTEEHGAAQAARQRTVDAHSAVFRHLGSFVTITIDGLLRGCIGTMTGREPLYENVWHMARSAAFADPRFSPLSLREWARAELHISVLDELTVCPDPSLIVIGRHGLALDYMGHFGVFLPQVPVEQGWNLPMYLEQLCAKAGVPAGSWRMPVARLFWYEALVFNA